MSKKQLLSFILATLICLALLPANIFAYNGEEPDITWFEGDVYAIAGDNIDGMLIVRKGGKYGYLDLSGKEAVPCIYDRINEFSEGLAVVETGYWLRDLWEAEKMGIVDKSGKEAVPFIYNRIWKFSEGLAPVLKGVMCGYIDKNGEEALPLIYEGALGFSEGLASVCKNSQWGYIDKSGKEIIPFEYDLTREFSEGLAPVCKNLKWGYVDKEGKEVFPCIYVDALGFSEGLAAVYEDGLWAYIDKDGKKVSPPLYQEAAAFSDGLAAVCRDWKWGYIDKSGEEVIPLVYDAVREFSEGLAAVRKGGVWGFIDKAGKEVVPCVFNSATSFSGGVAFVEKDGKVGVLNNPINPPAPANPAAGASSWAVKLVARAIETGIVPENLQKNYTSSVTRAEVAEMFVRLIEAASGMSIDEFLAERGAAINEAAFTDTSDRNVLACNALGIINGVGNNKFDPSGKLTRAHVAAILNNMASKAMDIETEGHSHDFTDTAGHWCDALLGWPVKAGIVRGVGNNKYNPEGQLTVEQTIIICIQALDALRR